MHDPMVVVFDIPAPIPHRLWPSKQTWAFGRRRRTNSENLGEPVYPWWRLRGYELAIAGHRIGMMKLITVWHNEPGGRDSGTLCKGMGGSDLTWHNCRWALKHWRHLTVQVQPYLRVKRWLTCRCAACGFRFFWNQARVGYMSSDRVWHMQCQSLEHVRGQREDALAYLRGEADDTQRWRVEQALKETRQDHAAG